MKKSGRFLKGLLMVLSLVSLFFGGGCVQALMYAQPMLTGAMVGSDIYDKNASTKVAFVEEEKTGSTKFKTIAIWPDNEVEVFIAEKLQEEKVPIVTPSAVGKVIKEQNLETILDNLTLPEVLTTLQTICEKTEADAVFGAKDKKAILFSLTENKIVWRAGIQAQYKDNSSPSEFSKIIANLVGNKIVELQKELVTSN